MAKRSLRESVKQRYTMAAERSSCCEPACCCDKGEGVCDSSTGLSGPSLGCGNPLAHVTLTEGMNVLDIGSGAGREVIEAARLVGPTGIAYGLDMTDAMLALALKNRRAAGVCNAVFIKGSMENIPLPNDSVDLVISNCVINLSTDKQETLSEIFRVLSPGGEMAVSDTVVEGIVPEEARTDEKMWCECLSGAMHVSEYKERLIAAGFTDVEVIVEGWYDRPSLDKDGWRVGSAFISAKKPCGCCRG